MKDYTHTMKDAGLVAASAAGQVDSEDKIVNLGAGRVDGKMIIDVTAIEIADNDESYDIQLQGSSESDFASTIEVLASMKLGAAEVLDGDQDSTIGRYEVPFSTLKHGTVYPYVREYCALGATVSTGINFSAHLVK
jgi:hypothetical protein